LLVDEHGVVILSTREQWKFRPLTALGPAALDDIVRTRPYGDTALLPIGWDHAVRLAPDTEVVRVEGIEYLASSRPVNGARWRVVVLDMLAPVRSVALYVTATAALASCVVSLLLLVGWQRYRGRQAMLASQIALQAAHDSLESRVVERTSELRKAQADLVHAEKMAALGQMSAGLVHELNQPLAAMRTLSDNACVLLDTERGPEARGNLVRIGRLVDRLGKLTRQLKHFARKPSGSAAPVAVQAVIASAQALHAERLRETGVAVEVTVEPPGLSVLADDTQLEQVVVNRIGNAVDAMADAPLRRLRIAARAEDGRCRIQVCDSGPGIRADILPRLFEPFVTGKPAGAGLGLGLLISANIVRDFGGSLRGCNAAQGGACFEIELPLAEALEEAVHG
ncbi:MAG: sensor histidine kinase, partial [Rhizobacter sp.]